MVHWASRIEEDGDREHDKQYGYLLIIPSVTLIDRVEYCFHKVVPKVLSCPVPSASVGRLKGKASYPRPG